MREHSQASDTVPRRLHVPRSTLLATSKELPLSMLRRNPPFRGIECVGSRESFSSTNDEQEDERLDDSNSYRDDLVSWYISFLKSLALQFNSQTARLFYNEVRSTWCCSASSLILFAAESRLSPLLRGGPVYRAPRPVRFHVHDFLLSA